MPTGQKHLIQCTCILHQFSKMKDPPYHQFVVFSIVDDDDKFVTHYAQCNNCGVIHRVIDLCKSEVLRGRESFVALPKIDEIKASLPSKVCEILDASNVDISTYENAKFIVDNQRWGEFCILSSEKDEGARVVKYLQIIGANIVRVETKILQEEF